MTNAGLRYAALALLLLPITAQAAEVTQPSRTQIVFTPVACPGKTKCNVFHIRYVRANGVVDFERDIPSAWMASSVSVEVRTGKGTIRVWSER